MDHTTMLADHLQGVQADLATAQPQQAVLLEAVLKGWCTKEHAHIARVIPDWAHRCCSI